MLNSSGLVLKTFSPICLNLILSSKLFLPKKEQKAVGKGRSHWIGLYYSQMVFRLTHCRIYLPALISNMWLLKKGSRYWDSNLYTNECISSVQAKSLSMGNLITKIDRLFTYTQLNVQAVYRHKNWINRSTSLLNWGSMGFMLSAYRAYLRRFQYRLFVVAWMNIWNRVIWLDKSLRNYNSIQQIPMMKF